MICAFYGLIGDHLLFLLSLISNALSVWFTFCASMICYSISIVVFLSHFLFIILSLFITLCPFFCLSYMCNYNGLWSDIRGSYSFYVRSILSSANPLVITMSMFVFFYVYPFPFLVQLLVSCTSHPFFSIPLFHYWYFLSGTSVLISKYITCGI